MKGDFQLDFGKCPLSSHVLGRGRDEAQNEGREEQPGKYGGHAASCGDDGPRRARGSGVTVDGKHFQGLYDLARTGWERFHRGVLLYTGTEVVPFGRNLHALPVSPLWHVGSR